MTPHITEFLSRARLTPTPYSQDDIDAAEARVLARLHTPRPSVPAPSGSPPPARPDAPSEDEAALNLKTLCETVVTRTTALDTLDTFLTPQLPEPPGARVLGCILQLADSEENARFWWQYAAGAGDAVASYCLYLHHLALGEHGEAHWWHEQTTQIQSDPPVTDRTGTRRRTNRGPMPGAVTDALRAVTTTDANLLPTALRILGALKTGTARLPALVDAIVNYVPAAVGHIDDDIDLPLPGPGFTDHIRALATPTETNTQRRVRNRLQIRPRNPHPGIVVARHHPLHC